MRERVREFLGIWAPLILGLLLITLAVSFLLSPPPPDPNPLFVVDPLVSAACGSLLIFVGAVLVVSTYGRWRKARLAQR